MSNKIILSADSTCDLSEELKKKYNINYCPFIVLIDGKEYHDGIDILPDEIYSIYRTKKVLPKTAAIGVGEYNKYFKNWVEQGYDIIHINISSAMSSSYQNCCMAAKELGNVYPIDSKNLSTGTGLLVLETAKRIQNGLDAKTIQKEVSDLTTKVQASFILDTLEFLKAGGRCSTIAAMGANLLKLKPCIEVDNVQGKMGVSKKYRGDLNKALLKYTQDIINEHPNIDTEKIFITHSGISQDTIDSIHKALVEMKDFKNIYITRAGCTVSSHCGPNTLGVLFMTH